MYGKPYTFTPSACPHMVPLSYGSLSVVHAYARRPFAYLYNPYHFLNPKGFTPSYVPRPGMEPEWQGSMGAPLPAGVRRRPTPKPCKRKAGSRDV
jgi:hypothetical protein